MSTDNPAFVDMEGEAFPNRGVAQFLLAKAVLVSNLSGRKCMRCGGKQTYHSVDG
jgi:hypothetical protein